MNEITFKRTSPDESRIYLGGDYVGDVYRQRDVLDPASHYYVVHLDEDGRGPVRVHERTHIREVSQHLLATHPLWN